MSITHSFADEENDVMIEAKMPSLRTSQAAGTGFAMNYYLLTIADAEPSSARPHYIRRRRSIDDASLYIAANSSPRSRSRPFQFQAVVAIHCAPALAGATSCDDLSPEAVATCRRAVMRELR